MRHKYIKNKIRKQTYINDSVRLRLINRSIQVLTLRIPRSEGSQGDSWLDDMKRNECRSDCVESSEETKMRLQDWDTDTKESK